MTIFRSFKVKHGDAFLLQTYYKYKQTILVDAGEEDDIVNRLSSLGLRKIDVLVCTHRDSDHAGGIEHILKNFDVRELWLPSEWGNVIATAFLLYLLRFKPNDFFEIDLKFIDMDIVLNVPDRLHGEDTLNILMKNIIDNGFSKIENVPVKDYFTNDGDYKFAKQIIRNIRNSKNVNAQDIDSIVQYMQLKFKIIRDIIVIALDNCHEIRWFKYGNTEDLCRQSDLLLPLNSKEVFTVKVIPSISYLYAQLSKQNRESLVFGTRKNSKSPPVMFCADSNLKLNEAKRFSNYVGFSNGCIVTVPHHGSVSNANAFKILHDEIYLGKIRKVRWIRGYNQSVKIGSWYTNEIENGRYRGLRYCAKCNSGDIVFRSRRKKWILVSGSSKCNC